MTEPAPRPAASCEECGYSLEGIVPRDSGGLGTCPECGGEFDAYQRWVRRAWPSPVALAARLCGPTVVLAVALIALGVYRPVRNVLVWPVASLWLTLMVMLCLLWPAAEISALAKECEPRTSRACRRGRLRLAVLGANAAVLLAGVIAFFAFL